MTLTIGNGAGFLGDQIDAPRRLVEAARLDYLTLEYLAELTLSILARQREKNPSAGYAEDFLEVLASLLPAWKLQPQLHVVTNAGGMNPTRCAVAAANILVQHGLSELPIGVVSGDDLLARLPKLQADGCPLINLDTGQPLAELNRSIVSANAYLGAQPIAAALDAGARLVITGRVADASLTVGPALHEFNWPCDDWQRLAGASVAGHLIECGAQVSGGYSNRWQALDLANVGFPIAELAENGTCVITKPHGSGGVVDRRSVIEQLTYEIGDPAHYLTPDVDVDFTSVDVEQVAANRVAVHGATGRAATDSYKVSLAYRDGYMASGQLLIYGKDCLAKAAECGQMIFERLRLAGVEFERTNVEYLSAGQGVPGLHRPPLDLREVLLRVTVHDSRREAVERFGKEIAPLITGGPAGLAGYASGRPSVRPVFAYWPTLIPKAAVEAKFEVRAARDMAKLDV